jgi:cytochrome oxidase Cu insertion factor (SCO1/SenC/PrrC family)
MKRTISFALMLCSCLIAASGLSPLKIEAAQQAASKQKASGYYCVMDPDVKSLKPGKCPKCGMDLRPVESGSAQPPNESRERNDVDSDSPFNLQIPDVTVYDQDGRKLKFFTDLVKDKTVAINFIFTTCTTICPPLAATFHRVQQELGDQVGRDVRMISISVDPVTDVPERLKAFAVKFKAGPGWTLVTGSKLEIDQLLKALGASVADKNDHTPMILIGNDKAGYWTRTYGLAPSHTLVKAIREAMSMPTASVDR